MNMGLKRRRSLLLPGFLGAMLLILSATYMKPALAACDLTAALPITVKLQPSTRENVVLNLSWPRGASTNCPMQRGVVENLDGYEEFPGALQNCAADPTQKNCAQDITVRISNPTQNARLRPWVEAVSGSSIKESYSLFFDVIFLNWNGLKSPNADVGEILFAHPVDPSDSSNGLYICWTYARTGDRTGKNHNSDTMVYTLHFTQNGKTTPYTIDGGKFPYRCYTLQKGEYTFGNGQAYVTVTNTKYPDAIQPIPMTPLDLYISTDLTFNADAEQIGYTVKEPNPGGIVDISADVTTSHLPVVGKIWWDNDTKSELMDCALAASDPDHAICKITLTGLPKGNQYTFTVGIKDGEMSQYQKAELDPITIQQMIEPPDEIDKTTIQTQPSGGEWQISWMPVTTGSQVTGYYITTIPENIDGVKYYPGQSIPQPTDTSKPIHVLVSGVANGTEMSVVTRGAENASGTTLTSEPVTFKLTKSTAPGTNSSQ